MDDPEECYQISKQTLELMDKFAGPVNSRQKNLPSALHFPEPLNFQPIQPNILKKAPTSMRSQIFVQHTEMDDNPNMPHYTMELQYMDFNQNQSYHQENKFESNWSYDNLTKNEDNDDDYDEDWMMLSQRARLKNTANSMVRRQNDNESKYDDNYFVKEDKEQLRKLRETFGFKFSPNVEYKLTQHNPLLRDDV